MGSQRTVETRQVTLTTLDIGIVIVVRRDETRGSVATSAAFKMGAEQQQRQEEDCAMALPCSTRLAITIFTLTGGIVGAACIAFVERFTHDEAAEFIAIQSGHMRRLDRSSADGRVVFLGSSTFQGLDTSAITPIGLNLSIGGDSLEGLLTKSSSYRSLASARAVVINIGFNDLMQSCSRSPSRVQALMNLIPHRTPIILVGVQETSIATRNCAADVLLERTVQYNRALRDECSKRSRCRFVPNPVTTGTEQSRKTDLMEADAMHLSDEGYRLLSDSIRKALLIEGLPG